MQDEKVRRFGMGAIRMAGNDRTGGPDGLGDSEMKKCRHGLSEDCPGCMQETIDALVNDLAEAVRLLDALLGLEKGSGAAAFAFVNNHRPWKGTPS